MLRTSVRNHVGLGQRSNASGVGGVLARAESRCLGRLEESACLGIAGTPDSLPQIEFECILLPLIQASTDTSLADKRQQ